MPNADSVVPIPVTPVFGLLCCFTDDVVEVADVDEADIAEVVTALLLSLSL